MEESHIHIGTSGWTYSDWAGRFYPQDLPKNQWLNFYTQHFNAVEINATFYRSFQETTYQHWREEAPPHFHYVIKASRYITHRKYLLNVADAIQRCETAAFRFAKDFVAARRPLNSFRLKIFQWFVHFRLK